MANLTCRIKEYIQPFERQLALQEMRALASGAVRPVDGDETTALVFEVAGAPNASALRDALTYWHTVGPAGDGLTAQVRGEATSVAARNGMSVHDLLGSRLRSESLQPPRKRCLRYATHGLHEYRGKFFPQLVRALTNIAQVPPNGIVMDPMCGSGTTLVEARLAGRRTYGLDMNPLSVFVSDAKCRALTLTPSALSAAYETLSETLSKTEAGGGARRHFLSLPDQDQAYLNRWFAPSVLSELDAIQAAIEKLGSKALHNFHRVCLSNILRGVSWQKDDDLRVRREVGELPEGAVIRRFLTEALRSTKVVGAFAAERGRAGLGRYVVREADARQAGQFLPQLLNKVDAVITSPPYATALPYLDTDRLSLIYLGLLPREGHRSRDLLMIGNREVTERTRAEYWRRYQANKVLLPGATQTLIDRINKLNNEQEVGFRRRNLAALLSKYFFDMRAAMQQMLRLLRPDGRAFLVVGNNRTVAGGVPVEIRTADHLTTIAANLGFQTAGNLSMEMLLSRDVFRKNAMQSEQIIALRKPRFQ